MRTDIGNEQVKNRITQWREENHGAFLTFNALVDLLEGGTDLRGLDLSLSDFRGGDFTRFILSDSVFRYADFEGAKLNETGATGADFTGANFNDAQMAGGYFREANFENATFRNARADWCCFNSSVLRHANFQNALLMDAEFEFADLTDSTLQGSNAHNASFRHAIMERTEMGRADLTGTDFFGALIRGTDFRGSNLTDALITKIFPQGSEYLIYSAQLKNGEFVAFPTPNGWKVSADIGNADEWFRVSQGMTEHIAYHADELQEITSLWGA